MSALKPTLFTIWGTEDYPNRVVEGLESGGGKLGEQTKWAQFYAPGLDAARRVYSSLRKEVDRNWQEFAEAETKEHKLPEKKPELAKTTFTYFKQSGKYYSAEDCEAYTDFHELREFAHLLQTRGELPGLVLGGGKEFYVLVTQEDGVPFLLMPKDWHADSLDNSDVDALVNALVERLADPCSPYMPKHFFEEEVTAAIKSAVQGWCLKGSK